MCQADVEEEERRFEKLSLTKLYQYSWTLGCVYNDKRIFIKIQIIIKLMDVLISRFPHGEKTNICGQDIPFLDLVLGIVRRNIQEWFWFPFHLQFYNIISFFRIFQNRMFF